MNKNQQKPPLSWTLIAVFLIVSVVVSIVGSVYIGNLKESVLETRKSELNAFADLKVRQIVRWWHERIGDAITIQHNIPLVNCIDDYLNKPDAEINRQAIDSLLNTYIDIFDYRSGFLFDEKGKVRLAIHDSIHLMNGKADTLIPAIFRTKEIMLTDIYRAAPGHPVQLDLIIPLEKKVHEKKMLIGRIILTLDPEKILYPLVKSWPAPSKTSETLLLKKDGDSVLYLSQLKHMPDTPPLFRKDLFEKKFLGAMAVSGFQGIAEGVDYRNVPVLGAIKRIPGTGWYMVSKVDMSEIYGQERTQVIPVLLLIVLAISSLGAVIGWTIWHQRVRFYRNKYESEAEKMALRKHFDYILKYANDIILLIDSNLEIVEVNDRALESYQYSREEMIGMSIRSLRPPEYQARLDDKIRILRESGSATYETVHKRKDGTNFPVEISARLFEIEGVKYFQSVARDITERKASGNKLNELLERYNVATSAARLAVWDYDILSDKLIWDDRVYELYDVKKDDSLPVYESWLKLLHPDDAFKADSDIKKAVAGGNEYNTEFRILVRNGEVKYIKAFGKVVRAEDGTPLKVIGINYDITEQKKAENLLREREFWLSQSQKIGKIGSYIFDIEKLIWNSSEVLDDIFGIDENYPRTLDGWNKLVHPEQTQEMLDYVRFHVVEGKNKFDREYRIINQRSGETVWVHGNGEVTIGPDGNVIKLTGTIQDISKRKKAEQLQQSTEQTYTVLFDTVSDAIYIHKTDGVFIDVNSGAIKMYGYPREEFIGMTPELVGAPGLNDLDELSRLLNRVFETGRSEQFEFWGRRKNGEIFPKEVITNKGKYFGEDVLISTARDVTARKNYEDQLKLAKEKAEESDRLKTAFLHNISHEIRTPMNAIVGFTSLLDEPDVDEASRKHFTGIINQSTNQLLSIISDIVDISNIETGQVKLSFNEVNLNEVISNLYDQFRITADEKNLLFFYEAKLPDEKASITTDKTKLIQVISNLLNNAFKFTKQGTVQFGYRLSAGNLEFFVKDTGIGVKPEYHGIIFDRFYQVDSISTRNFSGAGLGLSICKAYVEILGGKIWLNSKPGEGSEFCFSHPV